MSTLPTPETLAESLYQAGQSALDLQDKAMKWQLDQVRFAQTQAEVTARHGLKATEAAATLVRGSQQAVVDAFAPTEA